MGTAVAVTGSLITGSLITGLLKGCPLTSSAAIGWVVGGDGDGVGLSSGDRASGSGKAGETFAMVKLLSSGGILAGGEDRSKIDDCPVVEACNSEGCREGFEATLEVSSSPEGWDGMAGVLSSGDRPIVADEGIELPVAVEGLSPGTGGDKDGDKDGDDGDAVVSGDRLIRSAGVVTVSDVRGEVASVWKSSEWVVESL